MQVRPEMLEVAKMEQNSDTGERARRRRWGAGAGAGGCGRRGERGEAEGWRAQTKGAYTSHCCSGVPSVLLLRAPGTKALRAATW